MTAADYGLTKPTPADFNLERAAYSPAEACKVLSIGTTKLYALISEGRLPTVKLGRKTLIYATDIARLLASLQPAEARQQSPR
jgi:excisionase family DNA binding protein